MDAAQFLAEAAQQHAARTEANARKLDLEQQDIEARQRQIEIELHAARHAVQRALNFQARAGSDFFCPKCWIDRGRRAVLFEVSGSRTHNIMRCNECPAQYDIPLR